MSSKLGTLCIVLTAIAFGTMEISLKIAGTAFTPFQLTFLRFLVGGLLLMPPGFPFPKSPTGTGKNLTLMYLTGV